jgi:hypothetical protein
MNGTVITIMSAEIAPEISPKIRTVLFIRFLPVEIESRQGT